MDTAGVMHAAPPALTPDQARDLARERFGVDAATVRPLVSERDQNFALVDPNGAGWVLKVSNAAEEKRVVEMEVAAVAHVARMDPELPVPVARPARDGAPVAEVSLGEATHLVRCIPLLPGRTWQPPELHERVVGNIGEVTARMGRALRGFFHPAAGRAIEWDQQHLPGLMRHADLVTDPDRRALLDRVLERWRRNVEPALPALRAQVIHNDITLDNLLLDDDGHVTGVIDFGDMAHTALVLDVPATLQSLVREREDIFAVAGAFLPAYASVLPLEPMEADLLGDLLAGRMAQTILISAWRTPRFPDNDYITGWERPAWVLLEQLEAAGWDEGARRLSVMARAPVRRGRSSAPPPDADVAARRGVLGAALEPLTYRRPLHLVSGAGAWMYDAAGRGYLDAYNNVPVVGHAHPRVVDAIGRQASLLNTNTRYLHAAVVELAERLVASMPTGSGLDTVMFVNSGSEANDLAWRLARIATGGDAGLVTDWAYHGVTAAIADFSPSEWAPDEHPEGVETFPAPDTLRPAYAHADAARAAMAAAVDRLRARDRRPAALFLDGFFTADGIFTPEPDVVAALVAAAREAGAFYVADEVQSGHGRGGDGLWRFPAWGVHPDVVTLGKPMGNGHPIAAVVTRAELVDRMAVRTTFFSTFGGNPVACAAALAVLDVIDEEGLVAHAAAVGDELRAGLRDLAARHPVIADVRGRGLMTGVELVDPATGTPASALARDIRDELRERGFLVGATRREKNVLKIRPPLAITADEARLTVRALDEVLGVTAH